MKKGILIIGLVFFTTFAFAQKGSIYLGGGVGFDDQSWKVSPEIGTWLSTDLQLGAVLSFSARDNAAGESQTTIAPHVYFRKWWSIGEKFSIYAGANARLVSIEGGNTYFDGFIDAGFAYAVASRWGLVGRVGSFGYIDEVFKLDYNMSPSSLFNVGIYYTIKE